MFIIIWLIFNQKCHSQTLPVLLNPKSSFVLKDPSSNLQVQINGYFAKLFTYCVSRHPSKINVEMSLMMESYLIFTLYSGMYLLQ